MVETALYVGQGNSADQGKWRGWLAESGRKQAKDTRQKN
jgi:hypothetical protein